jgi:hypothetical protein
MTIHSAKLKSEPRKATLNQGYVQNWIHQTRAEFANLGHCPIVISRKMMWENTLKRENNYPPSTTSKVVLENENESISPDFNHIINCELVSRHKFSVDSMFLWTKFTQEGKKTSSILFLWVPTNGVRRKA